MPVLLLALLPTVASALQPHQVAVGPGGELGELDAHMRRADAAPPALLEAGSGGRVHNRFFANGQRNAAQDDSIRNIKDQQLDQDKAVNEMRAKINDTDLPKVKQLAKAIDDHDEPLAKFIEMVDLKRDTTVATTQKKVKQWKAWEFNEQQSQNKRVDANVKGLQSAQNIFKGGENTMKNGAARFLSDWKGYAGLQYGAEEGEYPKLMGKLNEKITRDTAARKEHAKRVAESLNDRIDFAVDSQETALTKLSEKSKSAEDLMSKKVDQYLGYGEKLLADSTKFGKNVATGAALMQDDKRYTDAEINKHSAKMLEGWKAFVSQANSNQEKQVMNAEGDIRDMFDSWQNDKLKFQKDAGRGRAELARVFTQDMAKQEFRQDATSKTVTKDMKNQGKRAQDQERSVERESNFFGLETEDKLKAAREQAEEQAKLQEKLQQMGEMKLSGSKLFQEKEHAKTTDSAVGNIEKASDELNRVINMGDTIVGDAGAKASEDAGGFAKDLGDAATTADKHIADIKKDAAATESSLVSSSAAAAQIDAKFDVGIAATEALEKAFYDHDAGMGTEARKAAEEEVQQSLDGSQQAFAALSTALNGQSAAVVADGSERGQQVSQAVQTAVAGVDGALSESQQSLTESQRAAVAGQSTLKSGASSASSALRTAEAGSEATDRAIAQVVKDDQVELADATRADSDELEKDTAAFASQQAVKTAQATDVGISKIVHGEKEADQQLGELDSATKAVGGEYDTEAGKTAEAMAAVEAGGDSADAALTGSEALASKDAAETEHAIQATGVRIKDGQVAASNEIAVETDAASQEMNSILIHGSKSFGQLSASQIEAQKVAERRLSIQSAGFEASLNKELGNMDKEQQKHVQNLVKGTLKLDSWAQSTQQDEETSTEVFLQQFDVVNAAISSVLAEGEHDAAAQQKALDAHMMMVNRMLDSGMEGVDEEVKEQMRREAIALNREMGSVLKKGGTVSDEQMENLKRLQANSKTAIMKVMSNSDQLGPELVKYKADQDAAKKAEEDWIAGAAGDANEMNTMRQKEQAQILAKAMSDGKGVLQSVMGALTSAENMQGDVKQALDNIATENGAELSALDGASAMYFGGVDNQLLVAKRESHDAQQGAAKSAVKSMQVVDRTAQTMHTMESSVSQEIEKLRLGMSAEQARAKAAVTALSDERVALMRELHAVLGEAGTVTTTVFERRLAALEELDTELEKQVDALAAAGHGDLAAVLRNSVEFAKKMLANLAHMKFVMYENIQLENQTDKDSAFANEKYHELRSQLVMQAETSVEKNAEFEQELQAKLKTLGVAGSQASRHLASMLHGLTFQLATGEKQGFDALLETLAADFGDSFGQETSMRDLIKGGLNDLALKQGKLGSVIDSVSKTMTDLEGRATTFEEKLGINLERIQELNKMSDDELWEKIKEVKAVINQLTQREAARSVSASLLDQTHTKEEDEAWGRRLADVAKRAARDRSRRAAASAEEEKLAAMLNTLRTVRQFQHRQ